ncbi:hypothetical protein ACJZ2D_013959 [Fusarium nematophilum]
MSSLVPEAPRCNDCSASSASEDDDDSPDGARSLGASYSDGEASRAPSSHRVAPGFGLRGRALTDLKPSRPKVQVLNGLFQDTIKRALRASSRFGDGFRYQRLRSPNLPDLETQPLAPLDRSDFDFIAGNDAGISFLGQIRATFVSSRLNWLLVFVPIGLTAHMAEMAPLLTFITNSIAIIPLSAMLTDATERIAAEAGDTIGALLNITLGNLVELILFVALVNNHIRIVQASILGSVLVNLLLILGSALFAASMASDDPECSMEESELLASLLGISVFVILIPTAFDYTFTLNGNDSNAGLSMSRASSLVVLIIYIVYFAYEMRPKTLEVVPIPLQTLHTSSTQHATDSQHRSRGSASMVPSTPGSRIIRFADEDIQGRARSTTLETIRSSREGEEESAHEVPVPDTRNTSYQHGFRSRGHSRSRSLSESRGLHSRESSINGVTLSRQISQDRADIPPCQSHPHPPSSRAGTIASVTILIATSAIMSMNAEFLVKTIDDVTHQGGLSEAMIGLIILPVVGNIAEYVTVVTVAARNKLDLAISVAVGSAIQIALCVAPLTVLIAWMLHRDLEMAFNVFETTTLVGTGLMVNLLILSRSSTTIRAVGLKGALMYACYVIIGLGAYFEPRAKS